MLHRHHEFTRNVCVCLFAEVMIAQPPYEMNKELHTTDHTQHKKHTRLLVLLAAQLCLGVGDVDVELHRALHNHLALGR